MKEKKDRLRPEKNPFKSTYNVYKKKFLNDFLIFKAQKLFSIF